MYPKTIRHILIVMCGIIVTLLAACANPIGQGSTSGQGGSLQLSFADHVSRSLLPGISMQPASYAINGSGPSGASFNMVTTSGSASVEHLAFGAWTVQVEARNANGTAIGGGSGSAQINSNSTSFLTITVRPFDGLGNLNLALRWNAGSIQVPQIQASLLPLSGPSRSLAFVIADDSASFAANDIASGYHTLSLKLLDNGALAMGKVEVVRIVAGQNTSGDFFFDKVNQPGGTLTIDIDQDMSDPLTVSILGSQSSKPQNHSLTLTGSIAETGVNASYVWYVNGEAKATGPTLELDPSWAQGWYQIDLTAFSADGKRAGSSGTLIQVTPSSSLYQISGSIRQNGVALMGVAVSLANTGLNTVTDMAGHYGFSVAPGNYTILTSKAGLSIVPDSYSRIVSILNHDESNLDFSAFTGTNTAIATIQGAGHLSPLNNQAVSAVLGVVTLVDTKQFYMQSLDPDNDPATSEGLLVYQGSNTAVVAGDWVSINAIVSEYIPQGASSGNLSVTEIKNPTITILSHGHLLPAPVVVGSGGRIPPDSIICNDAIGGTVDNSVFDPANDGIDFWESLEFMRVSVNNAQVTGPTIHYASSKYSETPLIGDYGANSSGLTARGGIVVSPSDFNPERVIINDKYLVQGNSYKVSDRFPGSITGVLDYTYGDWKIFASSALPTLLAGSLPKEQTTLLGSTSKLTIASYNTENLSIASPAGDIDKCAATIAERLQSPDILILCEVQDNNGPAAGDTDASVTWNAIISAISARGGPAYQYRDIAGVNNQDGGAPDGNIRQGFLFNPARVQFIDRAGGTATAATSISADGSQAVISYSPGRIDPSNTAFADSRKPLIGEFMFQGQKVYVIGNHFNSKGGDTPLFGKAQPPVLASKIQRLQQAAVVANFVDQILAIEPAAKIVLGGDFNDFEFSLPIQSLLGNNLSDLLLLVPANDRYSYVYGGNSQVLDHLIVSPALNAANPEIDVVHINAEYPDSDRSSDHDPLIARFSF